MKHLTKSVIAFAARCVRTGGSMGKPAYTLLAVFALALSGAHAADPLRDNDTRNQQTQPRDDQTRRDNPEQRNDAARQEYPAVVRSDGSSESRSDPPADDAEYTAALRKCDVLRDEARTRCIDTERKNFGRM